MLKQLIYSSFASPQFRPGDIGHILAACQRNNPLLGITGLLIVKDDLFLQALEGEAEAVQEIFRRIQLDSRHRDISIISWEPIKRRDFPNWSMGFKDLDTLSIIASTELVDLADCSVEDLVQNPSAVHALFQSIIDAEGKAQRL